MRFKQNVWLSCRRSAGAGCSPASIIVKVCANYFSSAVECKAFLLQKCSLHFEAALVASELAVRADGTMTRHNEWEWIVGQGVTDGPSAVRIPQVGCNKSIRADPSPRNRMLSSKDSLLEFTTPIEVSEMKGKVYGLACKQPFHTCTHGVNLRTRCYTYGWIEP